MKFQDDDQKNIYMYSYGIKMVIILKKNEIERKKNRTIWTGFFNTNFYRFISISDSIFQYALIVSWLWYALVYYL